jgi:hypothetical protein
MWSPSRHSSNWLTCRRQMCTVVAYNAAAANRTKMPLDVSQRCVVMSSGAMSQWIHPTLVQLCQLHVAVTTPAPGTSQYFLYVRGHLIFRGHTFLRGLSGLTPDVQNKYWLYIYIYIYIHVLYYTLGVECHSTPKHQTSQPVSQPTNPATRPSARPLSSPRARPAN